MWKEIKEQKIKINPTDNYGNQIIWLHYLKQQAIHMTSQHKFIHCKQNIIKLKKKLHLFFNTTLKNIKQE